MYYLYVAFFGAIGATARYWISITMDFGSFPYQTLFINILGSFLLAVILKYLSTLPKLSSSLINGLGTGLIGSFTTFSTFSVETSNFILHSQYLTALCYILSSLFGGFLSAALGFYISDKLITRRELRENAN